MICTFQATAERAFPFFVSGLLRLRASIWICSIRVITKALLAQNSIANAISKILYPNDNHNEGKSLRLRQQYFLCAAAVGDIVNTHMNVYGTLDNLAEKVAIHINDTHPTLALSGP